MTTAEQPQSAYPARLSDDYVGTDRNRLTTFFKFVTVIPILIVITALNYSAGAVLVLPVLLLILFRQKYPRWWFDFNVQYQRFPRRFGLYLGLVTDEYPPFSLDCVASGSRTSH